MVCATHLQLEAILSRHVPQWRGLVRYKSVTGGDINQAFLASDGVQSVFVKLNLPQYKWMFVAEAQGLNELYMTYTIGVPQVIAYDCTAEVSYLLLEALEFCSQSDPAKLGLQLARLHSQYGDAFGFHEDNFIGTTPQKNSWHSDWITFYREQRLVHQFKRIPKQYLSKQFVADFNQLMDKLPDFFANRPLKPSLIHGDLWSGNWGYVQPDASPVIFDPAAYYADHEMELAMMELFGSPGKAFFEAYQSVLPIDAGYSFRRPLYQLYHLLNHLNLFGEGYLTRCKSLVARLVSSNFS